MRPITYILLTLLILLVASKLFFTARRKKVRFMRVRSDSLPNGFLNTVCPQLKSMELPISSHEMSEPKSCAGEAIHAIAENADPDTPNQAVLYIEDYNIVLVSSGIVARIVRGDRRLIRKIAHWTEEFTDAFVVVANFSFFLYNNS